MSAQEELLDAHIKLSETMRDTHYGYTVFERENDGPVGRIDFARYVGDNRPIVMRGLARDWPAIRKWTNEYLEEKLGDNPVTVSLTGDGYADAVAWVPADGRKMTREGPTYSFALLPETAANVKQYPRQYHNGSGVKGHGEFAFASPYNVKMPFRKVLHHLTHAQPSSDCSTIAYCQLQDDCLRGPEYASLLADVPDITPSWATSILGGEPEAVNFWMGRHESVTSLHSDPFENIFTVVRGTKKFTLYPPCDLFFFHKKPFTHAVWLPIGTGECGGCVSVGESPIESDTFTEEVPEVGLVLSSHHDPCQVPWIPISHTSKAAPLYPRFAHAPKSFVIEVHAGDSLYLPRGWLHQVEQQEDESGLCVAVNCWYEGWPGMGMNWGWMEYAAKMEEIVGIPPEGRTDDFC